MFYGVSIESGPRDWQVFQRCDGRAEIHLGGRWQLEGGAIRAGVASATPVIRVVNEEDQSWVLPWTPCSRQTSGDRLTGEEVKGEWEADICLPQGGPYRLETSLDAVSKASGEHWMFHGDIRVHLGVGDVFCMAGQSAGAMRTSPACPSALCRPPRAGRPLPAGIRKETAISTTT